MNKVTFEDIDRLVEQAQTPINVPWLENAVGEHHNYHRFLYLLTEFMQPQVALEIGVFHGLGAMHMGEAAKSYGGKVFGIDNGTLVDYDVHKFEQENFEFIRADSCTQATYRIIRNFGKPLELVYHDSFPAYIIAKMEHFLYSSLMEKGTVWISDHLFDKRVTGEDDTDNSMRKFFNEIPAEQKKVYTDVLQVGIDQGVAIL